MIKYHDINSFSSDGEQLITPCSEIISSQSKIASNYSQEIQEFLSDLEKRQDRFYVVINALGSYERWGGNSNGDGFPKESLSHRVDTFTGKPMHDYGYKSFEHYAKYFRHHNNKPSSPSYGEVLFSYWNPFLERVELVVAMDLFKEKKAINALTDGKNVSTSMGCKVPFDVCNICGNKAPTRAQYCIHAKEYLRRTIGRETANKWSVELNKTILPGIQVCVLNTYPVFFDISRVHVGADNTSYILGKAASEGQPFFISGVDLADSYDVTDGDFESIVKVANSKIAKKKCATIIKNIPSSKIDGVGVPTEKERVVKRVVENSISNEPEIPNNILDHLSENYPLGSVINSMLSLGIHPKPTEFQRIIIVSGGNKTLANKLEQNGEVFPKCNCNEAMNSSFNITPSISNEIIQKILSQFVGGRSSYPDFLIPRLEKDIKTTKVANGGKVKINNMLKDIGRMYASLEAKARKSPISDDKFFPLSLILGNMLGLKIFGLDMSSDKDLGLLPAEEYSNVLKSSRFIGNDKVATLVSTPMIYKCSAYNQDPIYKGNKLLENKIFNYDIEKSTFPW